VVVAHHQRAVQLHAVAEIEQSDAAVFYNLLQEHDFDAGMAGWVADYNDPSNFLDLLRSGNSNNYGRYSNAEYDALLDQAQAEQDLERRAAIMARAETVALSEHPWIPMFFHVTDSLKHPYVNGWNNNINDVNRTRWVSIDEAARAAAFPNRYGD
jgi:oligopeptide transport system substrate-binding protein